MDLNVFLKEIQTKLVTNASSVPVYREDFVPEDLGAKRETGYIAWAFLMDYFVECSEYYSGTVEGDLDIISYARPRATRNTIYTDVLDLWLPITCGRRTSLGPGYLGDAYLHFATLTDIQDLFSEKTGHEESETPGIVSTFRIKISS